MTMTMAMTMAMTMVMTMVMTMTTESSESDDHGKCFLFLELAVLNLCKCRLTYIWQMWVIFIYNTKILWSSTKFFIIIIIIMRSTNILVACIFNSPSTFLCKSGQRVYSVRMCHVIFLIIKQYTIMQLYKKTYLREARGAAGIVTSEISLYDVRIYYLCKKCCTQFMRIMMYCLNNFAGFF